MRKIKLIRGNRKTSIPKRLIRKAVKEAYADILTPEVRKIKDPAKRAKAMCKLAFKGSKLTSEQKSIAFRVLPFEKRMMKNIQKLEKKQASEEKRRLMLKEASKKESKYFRLL